MNAPVKGSSSVSGTVLKMQMVGANANAQIIGQDLLPGVSNYLIGNDRSQWHTHVAHFGQVDFHNIYPGIDLVYHASTDNRLEYDFIVAPGANTNAIHLA